MKSKTFTNIRHIWRKYFTNSGFDDIYPPWYWFLNHFIFVSPLSIWSISCVCYALCKTFSLAWVLFSLWLLLLWTEKKLAFENNYLRRIAYRKREKSHLLVNKQFDGRKMERSESLLGKFRFRAVLKVYLDKANLKQIFHKVWHLKQKIISWKHLEILKIFLMVQLHNRKESASLVSVCVDSGWLSQSQ